MMKLKRKSIKKINKNPRVNHPPNLLWYGSWDWNNHDKLWNLIFNKSSVEG
jgi:hypothetical protein